MSETEQPRKAKNRFEQVDDLQEDAITLSLLKQDDGEFATVNCPAAVSGGRMQEDALSPKLPLVEGFRSAIKLANEMKAPVVVHDPNGLWKAEWGRRCSARCERETAPCSSRCTAKTARLPSRTRYPQAQTEHDLQSRCGFRRGHEWRRECDA